MFKKILRCVAVLAAAALILLAAHQTAAQPRDKALSAREKSAEKLMPLPQGPALADLKPGRLGTIFLKDDKFDEELQDKLAAALKAQQVPPVRLAAFRRFDTPEFRLDGWNVQLLEVDEGRSLVKLRAFPIMESVYGASTTISAAHDETYRYQNGELVLIDAKVKGVMSFMTE